MKESDYHKIIIESFRDAGGFAYKIADSPRGNTSKRPFDIFAVWQGNAYYIEVKMIDWKKDLVFDLGLLADHQIESLRIVRKNDSNNIKSLVAYALEYQGAGCIYFFDISVLVKLEKYAWDKDLPYSLVLKKRIDVRRIEVIDEYSYTNVR